LAHWTKQCSGIEKRSKDVVKSLKRFAADESGATAVEYALISSLVAIAIITSLNSLGSHLKTVFNEVASNLK
jgi:pilus assembly protein Flp/PilA